MNASMIIDGLAMALFALAAVHLPEIELTSALKQFAFNHGIEEGDDMAKFVKWGWEKMYQQWADYERK